MSTPWFFLSYATVSERNDKQVEGFCSDLVEALRVEASLKENKVPAGEIGFCAPTEMTEGTNWPKELTEKLRTCRVLVCLYSDSYFKSEACGKEFKLFSSRLDASAATLAGAQSTPLIVPVLWTLPTGFPDTLPRAASDLHHDSPYFDKLRHARGLFYLRTLASHKSEYDEYVVHLARIIKTVAEQHPLPPLDRVPPFHKVWNAWVEPPAPPDAVEAALTAPRQISLSWEDNSADEVGFYVERLRYGGRAGFVKLKEIRADSVGYTDARVAPGTKYRYRVCAYNAGGCSDYVETDDVETPGQPPPPMPSDLSGSALSTREIELRWVDNADGQGSFKIERCDGPDRGSFNQVGTAKPGDVVYKDGGLTPATTYIYRVCASDANSDSDYSDEVTVSTPPPRSPVPILILTIVAALAIIAALPFRCDLVPSLCPQPTPSESPQPATVIETQTWDDHFDRKLDSGLNVWTQSHEWIYPHELWTTVPGRDTSETDRALVVRGQTPGFPQKFFDNFDALFTVSYLEGTRAGWFLRSGDRAGELRGYKFVLVRGAQPSDGFELNVAAVGAPKSKISPAACHVPIYEYGKENDYIKVEVTALKSEFTYCFTPMNPRPQIDDRLMIKEPRKVCCPPIRDVGRDYLPDGRLGFFGEGQTVFKVEYVLVEPKGAPD